MTDNRPIAGAPAPGRVVVGWRGRTAADTRRALEPGGRPEGAAHGRGSVRARRRPTIDAGPFGLRAAVAKNRGAPEARKGGPFLPGLPARGRVT